MGNVSENYLPVVTGVAVVGNHVLRILFSDGTVGDVDFSAERWTGVLEPLNDPAYLAQATVDTEAGPSSGPTASTWHRNRSTSRLGLIPSLPPDTPGLAVGAGDPYRARDARATKTAVAVRVFIA